MLAALWQIIPTLLILGFLIFIHELGHFLACRWSKVAVEKFSIGFGPEIICWKGRETAYAISAIPLGGFVKPRGESFSDLQDGAVQPGDFLAASKWQRLIILLAGVLMNYAIAAILLVPVFHFGHPVLKAKIGGFVSGYPAETSDLRVGDEIVYVNDKPVHQWQEMTELIFENPFPTLKLQVKREGQVIPVEVKPRTDEAKDVFGDKRRISRIGISPSKEFEIEKFGWGMSCLKAIQTTGTITALTYKGVWRLVTGRMSVRTLSGPIGIMAMAGSAAQVGWSALLQLTAMISISLAVVNLLPIPALDGGHVLFLLIGLLKGGEVSQRSQERATQIGFAFLIALMVFVIYNDLLTIGAFERVKAMFGG